MQAHSNLFLTTDIERALNSLVRAHGARPGDEYWEALAAVADAFGIVLRSPSHVSFRVLNAERKMLSESGIDQVRAE